MVLGKHHTKATDSKRLDDTGPSIRQGQRGHCFSRWVEHGVTTAPIQGAMADQIRKALDTPFPAVPNEMVMPASEFLDILRMRTKGINILSSIGPDIEVKVRFTEAIPLGSLFQWAEDQFGWRFIVRDYGIVAAERNKIPPGAPLLLDLWRQGKPATAK